MNPRPGPAERLRRLLSDAGPWPAPVEHFASLDSTSDELKRRLADAPEWSVVFADTQTAGRGRSGHRWDSAVGGLYFSLVLRPQQADPRLPVLTLATGVAVAEAIEAVAPGPDVRLKWPNDLMCRDRKLGGVLAEAVASGIRLEAVVLGVGVNVAHSPEVAGDALSRATCLAAEGANADPLALAAAALSGLRLWYDARPPDVSTLLRSWRRRSVDWWGSEVEVQSPGGALRGIARDVDDQGALLLQMSDGSTRRVISGAARELRVRPT